METRLASGKRRTTSTARVLGGTSFVPVLQADELPRPMLTGVDIAAVKTVLYSTQEGSDSMHVVHPDRSQQSLALVRAVKPEPDPTASDLRRRPGGSSGVVFKLMITEGEWNETKESVSTKELVAVKFPSPVFTHEVVIYRPSRAIEICEKPTRVGWKKANVSFRRWVIKLDDLDRKRTKGFMELLEREFSDLRDQTMRRCLPSRALPPSSVGCSGVPIPEHAVVYHFPPLGTVVFTGFLASPEMQKLLRELDTGFVEETPLDEESQASEAERGTKEERQEAPKATKAGRSRGGARKRTVGSQG
ncbi:MAG: hypothetical protein Q9173_000494 [Seirophora scorigena]